MQMVQSCAGGEDRDQRDGCWWAALLPPRDRHPPLGRAVTLRGLRAQHTAPPRGQGRATQGGGRSLHVASRVSPAAHPRAKLLPGQSPPGRPAARTSSGGCRTFCRYFFSTSSGVLPAGQREPKDGRNPLPGAAEGMGAQGNQEGQEGQSLLPFLACFLVVLRQEWEMPGMDWISLLLTGGGCSTSLGGRVRHTGSPAALMRIPVIPAQGGNKWHRGKPATPRTPDAPQIPPHWGCLSPRPGGTSTRCGPILTCQCWVDGAGAGEVLHGDGGDPEGSQQRPRQGGQDGHPRPHRAHTTVA